MSNCGSSVACGAGVGVQVCVGARVIVGWISSAFDANCGQVSTSSQIWNCALVVGEIAQQAAAREIDHFVDVNIPHF